MRSIVIVAAFLSTLAVLTLGRGQEPQPTPQNTVPPTNKIKSIKIQAIGESFAGVRYSKSAIVSKLNDRYRFAFTCSSQTAEIKCPCRNFEADLEEQEAHQIIDKFRLVGGLLAGSVCCDHPYTLVSITDDEEKVHVLSVGYDILRTDEQKMEQGTKVLGIDCRRGLQPVPSPTPK